MYSSKVGEETKEIQFLCHNSKARLLRRRREKKGREGGREGGREEGREGGREGRKEGGREGGRVGRREGGRRERLLLGLNVSLIPIPAAVLVQF